MDWLKRMNEALAYMEDNLDGEMSIGQAAQIAACSPYQFQRMFSYIADIPLSDYLRRRRLTRAAFDLQSGEKVLDVALRYGYESPTAFNRAFRTMHGISPSAAKKPDTALKAYPPITFQITIKGAIEMNYRIVEKEAFRVVGIRRKEEAAPELVEGVKMVESEDIIDELIEGDEKAVYLFVHEENDADHYYMCVATDKPAPAGTHEIIIEKHTWAVFPGKGEDTSVDEDVAKTYKRIHTEWQPASGYDWAADIEMEIYSPDKTYEIWLPVCKK
ncbi:MAG: AraC family transcriptional regulator [Defluviitaleaceae bacterium]|nr:AraC family transcriptional regulator [Defluviitaleaceae bacterium]